MLPSQDAGEPNSLAKTIHNLAAACGESLFLLWPFFCPQLEYALNFARICHMNRATTKAASIVQLLLCIALTGCILIPLPTSESKVLLGQPVSDEQVALLAPGVSTQSDVIQLFGTPRILWEDERIFVYPWDVRQGILLWAVGGGYTGAAGLEEIPRHCLLLIQFDHDKRVLRYEKTVCPLSETYAECLREWARKPSVGNTQLPQIKLE